MFQNTGLSQPASRFDFFRAEVKPSCDSKDFHMTTANERESSGKYCIIKGRGRNYAGSRDEPQGIAHGSSAKLGVTRVQLMWSVYAALASHFVSCIGEIFT